MDSSSARIVVGNPAYAPPPSTRPSPCCPPLYTHLSLQGKALASMFPETVKGIVGSPREDLVVQLFGRVVDIDNFSTVLAVLSADGQLSVGRRLGWLNLLNPHHPDR